MMKAPSPPKKPLHEEPEGLVDDNEGDMMHRNVNSLGIECILIKVLTRENRA